MGLTTYTYNCPNGHRFETGWPFGRAPQKMMCGHCGNKEAALSVSLTASRYDHTVK